MLEGILEKLKEIVRKFISLDLIDKILGLLRKAQDIVIKVIETIGKIKDWLVDNVMNLFGE